MGICLVYLKYTSMDCIHRRLFEKYFSTSVFIKGETRIENFIFLKQTIYGRSMDRDIQFQQRLGRRFLR